MKHLENGKEYPAPNEKRYIAAICALLRKSMEKEYAHRKMLRRFHAKAIGLVEAEFSVEELPESLQIGLFKGRRTLKAWVRFSNAAQNITADYKRGVRGMAIKVLQVGEDPLQEDKMGQTQDFVLTTNKFIFPGTVKKYLQSLKGLFTNFLYLGVIFLNPFNWRGILTLVNAMIRVPDILEATFYSATPYLFGEGKAVKWQARPLVPGTTKMPENPRPDFLTHRLTEDLSKGEFSFGLFIQQQENPVRQPIEDPNIEWTTPLIQVATLTIFQQSFDTTQRKQQAETMSFSPWHALPQHRPLGGINRVRKSVYEQLSRLRNEHNEK